MEMIKMIINFREEVNLEVGDEVSTTTSEFSYDNYYGVFANREDLTMCADVEVKYTHSDYSEYDPRTCRNGGNYGYDYYIVTKINEIFK